LWGALAIAKARGVARLIFGSIDFQVDVGVRGDDQLDFHRAQLVLVSRVGGIDAPVDGVSEAIDDVDALARDVARARRQGFGGKLCIHPKQVAAGERRLSPDDRRSRLGEARRRRRCRGERRSGRGRRQDGRSAGHAEGARDPRRGILTKESR
jgi:citrate lyase beta subunit